MGLTIESGWLICWCGLDNILQKDRLANDRSLLGKISISELVQGGDAWAMLSPPSSEGGSRILWYRTMGSCSLVQ